MANFYNYTSNGKMTLTAICSQLGCNKSDLITINDQPYNDELTVGQYLRVADLKGAVIKSGITIKVPLSLTGAINTLFSSHKNFTTLLTTRNGSDTKYNVLNEIKDKFFNNTLTGSIVSTVGSLLGSNKNQKSQQKLGTSVVKGNFNCFMYALLNGSPLGSWELPVYPNEFSDSNGANFNSVGILGRSVDYQIYQGSSRDVSFTLQLHEELCSSYDYVHNLVSYIESACYPGYSGGVVQVPEIYFNIGNQFKVRGIITSCSANWKAPIIDGRLVNCDLSLGIKETTGPYSLSQVRSMGGRRG